MIGASPQMILMNPSMPSLGTRDNAKQVRLISVNFVANPLYKRGDLLIDWIS